MPLVFTENEETESGITYQDRTGISYQYPKMYHRIIQPGERFVYYRGRRKKGGGRAPQVYFGSGVVGNVASDPRHKDRFTCDILDYHTFPVPIDFKDVEGRYFERGAQRRGYFQRGVRVITEGDLQRILEAVQIVSVNRVIEHERASDPTESPEERLRYASSETARAIEDFAVRVALEAICA